MNYTVSAAMDAGVLSEVYVSSDCPEILAAAKSLGATPVPRPLEIAGDDARTEWAVRHVLIKQLAEENTSAKNLVVLQATSPLRGAEHIRRAVREFERVDAASLVGVCRTESPAQKTFVEQAGGRVYPLAGWEALGAPTQLLPPTYAPNGSLYICGVDDFLQTGSLYHNPLQLFKMDPESSIDIDTYEDLEAAEKAIEFRRSENDSL